MHALPYGNILLYTGWNTAHAHILHTYVGSQCSKFANFGESSRILRAARDSAHSNKSVPRKTDQPILLKRKSSGPTVKNQPPQPHESPTHCQPNTSHIISTVSSAVRCVCL